MPVAKYDYLTLKAKGEQHRVTKKASKPKKQDPGESKGQRRSGSIDNRSVESLWPEPEPKPATTDSNFFWPDVVLGEEPQGGLRSVSRRFTSFTLISAKTVTVTLNELISGFANGRKY